MASERSFQLRRRMMYRFFSLETLKAICHAVSIPVVAIGGISRDNIDKLYGSGIDGVAVISAIFGQKDIKKATKELVCKTKKL